MAELKPIQRKSIKVGLINEGAVSQNDFPADGVTESLNFHFDTIGKMSLRPGCVALGNQLSGNTLGLYEFRDSGSGTNNQIIQVNGTVAYYLSGSTWTSKRTGLTTGSKARFSTFLDYVFMVNGVDATAIWDGNPSNDFVTTGNALSAPIGKYIANYRSRIWIAGNPDYPDRVYYSSLPSSVATPVITWNTSVTTGNWIDISPSDGENITAIHRTKTALLIFKQNHIYRIFSINSGDPDPQFDVGTWSAESVVETKNGVYFHHPTGFFRYDGVVTEVSRPVIDIVRAITLANYTKVAGWLDADGDHICWSVGNVTYNGVTYSNLVVRYSISSQVWTHYSYPTQMLVSSNYNDGSTRYVVVGDNAGNILKADTGVTDINSSGTATPISYSITHSFDNLDGQDSTRKTVNKLFFSHTGMTGGNVSYQIPAKNDPAPIGQLKEVDTGFDSLVIQGQSFKFRLSGTSSGQPIHYEGYEVTEFSVEPINYS